METLPDGRTVPLGSDFLKLVYDQEDQCEADTDEWLAKAGVKAPRCLAALGTVLSLLDRLASCWWGCLGGDHLLEYLIGRAVSNARAALKLLRSGFYDEALALTRSIGENANILSLFAHSTEAYERWGSVGGKERRQEFSPVKVRLKLEELGAIVPMDEENYSKLCEAFAHVNPHTKPQAHNILAMPVLGGFFQEAGVLVTLNELASIMVSIAGLAGVLLSPPSKKEAFVEAIKELGGSIGGIDFLHIKDYWEQVRQSPEFEGLESLLKEQQASLRKAFARELD